MLAQTSCGAHPGSQRPSVSNEKRLVYQLKENLGWCRSWSTLLRLLGPTVCVRGSYRATRPEGRGVIARQRGSYRSDTPHPLGWKAQSQSTLCFVHIESLTRALRIVQSRLRDILAFVTP
ncbi:hypothetical protein AFLA70_99g002771 [Aspergillus flavus AF70]|nr:hypothetical protein AFLA70_99g002771 [Aspergillus flavus AF70]